jgi:hypothetical protein
MSGGEAHDATARAMALTAELGARFGAGGLALCKPRLDAAALVAASDTESVRVLRRVDVGDRWRHEESSHAVEGDAIKR